MIYDDGRTHSGRGFGRDGHGWEWQGPQARYDHDQRDVRSGGWRAADQRASFAVDERASRTMDKPFRIVKKDGGEPTPEEAKLFEAMERIVNHRENAEPILEEGKARFMHHLLYGHEYVDQGDGLALCGLCNRR